MKFLLKKVEDHYYLLSNEKICGKGYRMDMIRNSIGVIDDQEYYNQHPNDFKLIIASTNNLQRVALIDIINLSKSFKLDQEREISTQRTEWVTYVEMVNSPTHIDRYGDLRYNKYEPKVTDGFINILRIVDYETN